jgi:preprotein translocase subunit YajC
MGLSGLNTLIAFAPPLLAQGTPQTNPAQQMFSMVAMIVIMLVMFYFVLFRPQQKKQKEHAQMLKGVRRGDKILTTGGVVGTVINVNEKGLTIRSADSKLEITKSAVGEVLERGGESGES